jgi:hypothetical protein
MRDVMISAPRKAEQNVHLRPVHIATERVKTRKNLSEATSRNIPDYKQGFDAKGIYALNKENTYTQPPPDFYNLNKFLKLKCDSHIN